jgi:hypothetical protein
MPYIIKYSQKGTSKIGIAEIATARETLAEVRGLDMSDEDVRSVKFPNGREFEVFRSVVAFQALLKELERAAEQESET